MLGFLFRDIIPFRVLFQAAANATEQWHDTEIFTFIYAPYTIIAICIANLFLTVFFSPQVKKSWKAHVRQCRPVLLQQLYREINSWSRLKPSAVSWFLKATPLLYLYM